MEEATASHVQSINTPLYLVPVIAKYAVQELRLTQTKANANIAHPVITQMITRSVNNARWEHMHLVMELPHVLNADVEVKQTHHEQPASSVHPDTSALIMVNANYAPKTRYPILKVRANAFVADLELNPISITPNAFLVQLVSSLIMAVVRSVNWEHTAHYPAPRNAMTADAEENRFKTRQVVRNAKQVIMRINTAHVSYVPRTASPPMTVRAIVFLAVLVLNQTRITHHVYSAMPAITPPMVINAFNARSARSVKEKERKNAKCVQLVMNQTVPEQVAKLVWPAITPLMDHLVSYVSLALYLSRLGHLDALHVIVDTKQTMREHHALHVQLVIFQPTMRYARNVRMALCPCQLLHVVAHNAQLVRNHHLLTHHVTNALREHILPMAVCAVIAKQDRYQPLPVQSNASYVRSVMETPPIHLFAHLAIQEKHQISEERVDPANQVKSLKQEVHAFNAQLVMVTLVLLTCVEHAQLVPVLNSVVLAFNAHSALFPDLPVYVNHALLVINQTRIKQYAKNASRAISQKMAPNA